MQKILRDQLCHSITKTLIDLKKTLTDKQNLNIKHTTYKSSHKTHFYTKKATD